MPPGASAIFFPAGAELACRGGVNGDRAVKAQRDRNRKARSIGGSWHQGARPGAGAFFANIDVDLLHFIRRSDCCDLQSRGQPGWGQPQAQAGTFASKA